MKRRVFVVAVSTCLFLMAMMASAQSQDIDFDRDIAPLLVRRCLECHQASNPSGDFSMETRDQFLKGGSSGVLVVPGKSAESELIRRVMDGEMPPQRQGHRQPLTSEEMKRLVRWIDSGADWPDDRTLDLYEQSTETRGGRDLWSLQPLRVVTPPFGSDLESEHPIDAFVSAELQKQGLTRASPATRNTLIRRLCWTLLGLPPTVAEIREFEQAADPREATDRLIETLLQSPHFGERWGRHWLDIVRFAETSGYERDQVKLYAWKYRDWVVEALNQDMPYDDFIRHQLAGDQIPGCDEKSVIATGFLRLGTWNDEPNDPDDYQFERIEDLVHVTSTAFLGLTTKCARCHDHKFDPIPQHDYYRMAAAFWPGPISARGRELLGGPSPEELGYAEILGWTDITSSPSPLHRLKNGERLQPMEAVDAGSLSIVPSLSHSFTRVSGESSADGRPSAGTGYRLQLANWIADPDNPVTARVIVNRIWQHHFGEGLVRSSDNFGFTGDRPSHPELLDWLAAELIRSGWSLRHIHRLILTSSTWQQSSIHPHQDEYYERDAANRWLWRMNRRRRDAESLRDALLFASGEIDLQLGGPSFYPTISEDALEGLSRKAAAWNASPESEQNRRSLYMFMQRSLLPPLMTTFDLCDSTMPCGRRDSTIVAPQALTLLNNEFVHNRAIALAVRLNSEGESGSDSDSDSGRRHTPGSLISAAWNAVLGRDPDIEELAGAEQHLLRQTERFERMESKAIQPVRMMKYDLPQEIFPGDQRPMSSTLALASLCVVLFNTNEFAYVD